MAVSAIVTETRFGIEWLYSNPAVQAMAQAPGVNAGAAKVVEFDFDLASDTAMSVASEMVEEMSLSHSDAERIALAIKDEIWNLTHKLQQGAEHTSTGSASDDEAAGKKGPPSEGSAKPEVGARLRLPRPACHMTRGCPHPPGSTSWCSGRTGAEDAFRTT